MLGRRVVFTADNGVTITALGIVVTVVMVRGLNGQPGFRLDLKDHSSGGTTWNYDASTPRLFLTGSPDTNAQEFCRRHWKVAVTWRPLALHRHAGASP